MTVRMPADIIENLHEYARFLGSTLDHVVIEALKLVFKKDAEFKAWQSQQTRLHGAASAADCTKVAPPVRFSTQSAMAIRPQEKRDESVDPRHHAMRSVAAPAGQRQAREEQSEQAAHK